MFDLLLFRCFPEVWRGRFGPFLSVIFISWRWLFTLGGGQCLIVAPSRV
jgi:hypothetical protein